jgi:ribosomal protein S18 acetylase RimI-like enzyme
MISQPNVQSPPVLIRPVQLSDAANLNLVCWPARSLDSVADFLNRTQKLTHNRRGLGVVAVWDDAPCAFGLLTLWPRAAEISDLIVNPQHRNRGIGRMIIAYLTDAARKMHVHTLEIGVALSNPRALALYRRLAFTDGRIIELDLGNGLESVLYLYKNIQN